jgi:putative ABC transport system permease protein
MIAPRWRKVIADLWKNKTRTLLMIVTIGIGVFAVGMVTTSFIIALGDMDAGFQATNPQSGFLYTNAFDDDLLHRMRSVSGIKAVEGRTSTGGKAALPNGKTFSITIESGPDQPKGRSLNLLKPIDPVDIPTLGDKDILVERSAITGGGLKIGDPLTIDFEGGKSRTLRIVGFVGDMQAPPFTFAQQLTGYVNLNTLEWLGGSRDYGQLIFNVSEKPTDEPHVTAIGQKLSDEVKRTGREVYYLQTAQPGKHFASTITASLGILMGGLGFLAVALSAFLVVSSISNLLSQQIRQIGIMKSIGGRTGQITIMYLSIVTVFGLLSFAIFAPLATSFGYQMAQGFAGFLNFDVGPQRMPPEALALMLVIAVGVPLGVALFPIWRGTRITIREAITSYGLSGGNFGRSLIDRIIEKISFLSRPMLISLRNTFRRKGRLLLTLSTLTLAGAVFIAVLNLRASFDALLPKTLGYFLSDVNVSLGRSYRLQQIEPLIRNTPHVVKVEGWAAATGEALSADKNTAIQIVIIAPPADSTLIKPDVKAGRWIQAGDDNAIVVGNHFTAKRPDVKIGDELIIKIQNKETHWRIVGFYQVVGNVGNPILYANDDYLNRLTNNIGAAGEIRIQTDRHDGATQQAVVDSLKQTFKDNGIQVGQMLTGDTIVQANNQTLNIMIILLMVMAVLVAVVGGIGLMSTMSMNVMERTREIGVMRAIGARNRAIFQIVIVEGMLIGMISWALGALLSLPISSLLASLIGSTMMNAPMEAVFSYTGMLIWLAMVWVISGMASFLPAWNAMRLTVREVLAYE